MKIDADQEMFANKSCKEPNGFCDNTYVHQRSWQENTFFISDFFRIASMVGA